MVPPPGVATSNLRLARLLGHPLRQHVLFEYGERDTSPGKVAAALGAPLNLVSYHTRVLLDAGFIELVGTRRVRGAVEHTYRGTARRDISDEAWASLPPKLRRSLSRLTIDGMFDDVQRALAQDAFDRSSPHVSRSYLVLDTPAQEQLADLLTDTLAAAARIQEASSARGGASARVELLILAFERASHP